MPEEPFPGTESPPQQEAIAPPTGLGVAGKRLWRKIVLPDMEFDPPELLQVEEAARVADTLAKLRKGKQEAKVLVEIRLQQEQLRKLLNGIRWPEEQGGTNMSDWGRHLAQRRWRKSG